ncbi:MAG: hypothetical protein Q4A66_06565 [Eubacteriales bacterium]|nr:hypothetical protein [Eubacteriales bacterium]
MSGQKRRAAACLALVCALTLALPALAEQEHFICTPEQVAEQMNRILSGADGVSEADFAVMIHYDDAGGFHFCGPNGEHMLVSGETHAFVRGMVTPEGHMDELELVLKPRGEFGPQYGLQADRVARACMLSMFSSLAEGELALLNHSYLYDVRPYYYREGDEGVAVRERMCEIELRDEVVRFDGTAGPDDALRLRISFLYNADEAVRERAKENGWRIQRLSQAASECELIRTCGEWLDRLSPEQLAAQSEEIDGVLALALQSAEAIRHMENEHFHAQAGFLQELHSLCGQLDALCAQYAAAHGAEDATSALTHLTEIRRLCEEIGLLPESLY